MAKSENQKLKLLYILRILYEESDENHPVSTKDLIEKLAAYDIKVERKTIYTDIECLLDFGIDIGFNANKRTGGYYICSRLFETAELKLLVDMVQSSRFLSTKKSRELIDKLEELTNKHAARELQRTVYVTDRAKSENETIYYSVDKIHKAIADNKTVSFQYYNYNISKEMELRGEGKLYEVSPYYLTWSNENYYLIGFDNKKSEIRHYRVDRMKRIEECDDTRCGSEAFASFNIAEYSNGVFGMYGGEKTSVTIECANELAGVVIDRFGKDISIRKNDDKTFHVSVKVVCSGQFYGWLAGLGVRAKIVSPKKVKEAYHEYIGNIYLCSE